MAHLGNDMPYTELLHFTHKTNYQVTQFPIVGPWLSRTGHVVNILATPGGPDAQIWVEAFFYALPRLVWLKYKPFLQAEEWYRFLNARCGRNKRNRGKVADFARVLGLKESGAVPTPGLNGTVKVVFEAGIDFGLKLEWYLMIADRVTEFAYNWTSLAYQWNGTEVATEPHCRGSLPPGYHFEGEGNPVKGWDFYDQYLMSGTFTSIIVGAGDGASVSFMLDSLPSPFSGNQIADISARLVSDQGSYSGPWVRAQQLVPGLNRASDTYFYGGEPRPFGEEWSVLFTNNSPDILPYLQGTFQAFGTRVPKKAGLRFDP